MDRLEQQQQHQANEGESSNTNVVHFLGNVLAFHCALCMFVWYGVVYAFDMVWCTIPNRIIIIIINTTPHKIRWWP